MNTCFFIGHSTAPVTLKAPLFDAVLHCIEDCNVTHFIVGQYGAFDAMAAGAVKRAKELYPHITLQLLLPYHPAQRPVSAP